MLLSHGTPRVLGRRGWLGLGALLLLALGGVAFWKARDWRRADQPVVVLVDPDVDPGLGPGEDVRFALGSLLQDVLEHEGRLGVFRVPFPPAPEALAKTAQPEGLVLRFRAVRQGHKLQWTLRRARFKDLQGPDPYRDVVGPALPPHEAFRWVVQQVAPGAGTSNLLPARPEAFWSLLQGVAEGADGSRMDGAITRLEALAAQEGDAPLVAAHLGVLRYLRMNNTPARSAADQVAALEHFRRALAQAPGLGRAVAYLSRLHTDVGSPREALALVAEVRKQHPGNLTVLASLAYPARYAGLLDLAQAASAEVQARNPFANRPGRLLFHQLYAGQWEAFQTSLWEWPGDGRNATCRFHRGHVALLRGDRERALSLFRETEQMVVGQPVYRALARVHRLILEGQPVEARRELEAFQEERRGLRVPDGEMTLLAAEAAVALGDQALGMTLARGAFSQGFGCTRWFEQDPLLQPLRTHPQWPWLIQHLKERQALLESRFTRDQFGL